MLSLRRLLSASSTLSRRLSSSSSSSTSLAFDRHLKRLQRDNAARAHRHGYDDDQDYDYLRREIATRLIDRLDDMKREEGFPLALDLGSGPGGYLHKVICSDDAIQEGGGGIGGVRKLVQLDSSYGMLHRDDDKLDDENNNNDDRCESYPFHADEEAMPLPFPDGTFDLVLSAQSLHWVNNLPQVFSEVKRILKPDGCFMFAMIGGTTLPELRVSMVLAEMERDGGVGPHVGPFIDGSDVGSLLQSAGFALPTIDVDSITLSYPSGPVLMEHLQRMGENAASVQRRERTGLDTFLAASCIYDEKFAIDIIEGEDDDDDDKSSSTSTTTVSDVEASLQIIYAIGWVPHESQQKPLARGSAQHRVGDIVEKHSGSSEKSE